MMPNSFLYASTLHVRSTSIIVWFVQSLLLLAVSKTVGVTHWKLSDDVIISATPSLDSPAVKNQNEVENDDLYHLSATDPEFALLLRYSAKTGGSEGSLNRGGSGHGVFRRQFTGSCCIGDKIEAVKVVSRCLRNTGESGTDERGECHQGGDRGLKQPRNPDGSGLMSADEMAEAHPIPLTCGEPVEYTVYDFLKGIARRNELQLFPEPEVAMIFKKSETDNAVNLFDVEMGLRRAYQENPESLTVLNQIGNFWRIKGNTQHSIECFRKALSISPDHPDLLLNLARVLFNLKFYDDAVFLAKRSLHMKSSDSYNHAWLQYFTLGEVYKALEKYEEAAYFFKKSLEKNPGLHVAEMHLHELGLDQHHSVNAYTLVIIFALIAIVLIIIYYLIGAMSS